MKKSLSIFKSFTSIKCLWKFGLKFNFGCAAIKTFIVYFVFETMLHAREMAVFSPISIIIVTQLSANLIWFDFGLNLYSRKFCKQQNELNEKLV